MTVTRSIRTPIMHRVVQAGPLVFVGGTIADDTSVGMGAQTENILGKIEGFLREVGLTARRSSLPRSSSPTSPTRRRWTPSGPPSSATACRAARRSALPISAAAR